MTRLVLITGSRQASMPMIAKLARVIMWIASERYELIVGEASGIDEACRYFAPEFGLRPYVYGANGTIRQPDINPEGELRVTLSGGYLRRNRVMGDRCSMCIALWNGQRLSSGTVYTARYCEDQIGRASCRVRVRV